MNIHDIFYWTLIDIVEKNCCAIYVDKTWSGNDIQNLIELAMIHSILDY